MEALGEYLKDIRMKQNISIEKVIEDTHIVRKFVEAIENEQFMVFPGEAYLKGFIRTYSEYLGIDAEDVIRRYEKIKMVETPMPMEQLIPKPTYNLKPVLVIGGISVLGIFLIVMVVFLFIFISNTLKTASNTKKDSSQEKVINKLGNDEAVFNMKKNDEVDFNIGDKKYSLAIKELSPAVTLVDQSGKEIRMVATGYQNKVDVNSDQSADLIVVLNSYDTGKQANLSFKLLDTKSVVTAADSSGVININGSNIETIIKKPAAEDISCELTIMGETYLKYIPDGKNEIEGYYKVGSTVSLKSKSSLIIYFSNAGASTLNLKAYGKIYNIGEVGKIEVKLIKWVQGVAGDYELQISSLK